MSALEEQITAIIEQVVSKRLPALLEEKLRAAEDEWLTVKQASKVANISQWTVRRIAREGQVAVYQPNPGKPPLRISRNSLHKYMAA
jgi:excisionase family DNA binding protein